MSREGIKAAIRTRVAVRGRTAVRPATTLRAGDVVVVAYPVLDAAGEPPPGPAAVPEPEILHDDAHLLAVNKPPGILVHPTASSTGPSLLGWLRSREAGPLHLVHRLDRDTSGAVVLARTAEAARTLSRAFASGEVAKTYLAVVFGSVGPDAGTIELPLGKASGSAVHVKQGVAAMGRPARTDYRVIERLDGFTLLELSPRTGRRHQIRVHLQAIGHPVAGDRLYGARESHHVRFRASGFDERMRRDVVAERHLLHAASLELPHPETGRRLTIAAPLPADMAGFVERRRARS